MGTRSHAPTAPKTPGTPGQRLKLLADLAGISLRALDRLASRSQGHAQRIIRPQHPPRASGRKRRQGIGVETAADYAGVTGVEPVYILFGTLPREHPPEDPYPRRDAVRRAVQEAQRIAEKKRLEAPPAERSQSPRAAKVKVKAPKRTSRAA